MLIKMKIAKNFIGKNQQVFIIAEAGVNHNGKLALAKKLVDAAKKAGADAVKFQTFKAENLVIKNVKITNYQKRNLGKNETQLAMLEKLELQYGDFVKLKKYCDKKKIIFLSAPHSPDAIDFLEPLVPAFKVGSGDLTNLPFLEKIAQKKKPIILSTGMATLKEVKEAVRVIKRKGNKRIILLHCTTNYPCPLPEVNLRSMLTLKKEFNLPVGYSDHTQGNIVPMMAALIGASVIEKHFTLDKNLPGPDHKASLDPAEFKEMVKVIRIAQTVLGSGSKKPTKSEEEIKKVIRKSIVASRDINKGEKISESMLSIKRPGTGIEPKYFNKIIDRKARQNIKKDELISWKKI